MTVATASLLVGSDLEVPVLPRGTRRYVSFNYAATTPCLIEVKQAVDDLLPWYGSVGGRGADWKSKISTAALEDARVAVAGFVNARSDDCVIFTKHTTDSVNLMVSALPDDAVVVTWESSHHAALLPPSRRDMVALPIPDSPGDALEQLEAVLKQSFVHLVVVTGASNVTGEIWPYEEITRLAHQYGARVLLDAAQLAPHHAIDLIASDVDWVVFSGHKLYAPYGTGVLIGRRVWLASAEPFLVGGGAVDFVRVHDVLWAELPARQEAGTPNVIGAHALGQACLTLQRFGMGRIADTERFLVGVLHAGLLENPAVRFYRMWSWNHPRIGVLPFTVDGVPYSKLATVLSTEYAYGIRGGCFCAHPLIVSLLEVGEERAYRIALARRDGQSVYIPGADRVSLGIDSHLNDVIGFILAVEAISDKRIAWTYECSPDGMHCWPDPDPRVVPCFTRH